MGIHPHTPTKQSVFLGDTPRRPSGKVVKSESLRAAAQAMGPKLVLVSEPWPVLVGSCARYLPGSADSRNPPWKVWERFPMFLYLARGEGNTYV